MRREVREGLSLLLTVEAWIMMSGLGHLFVE